MHAGPLLAESHCIGCNTDHITSDFGLSCSESHLLLKWNNRFKTGLSGSEAWEYRWPNTCATLKYFYVIFSKIQSSAGALSPAIVRLVPAARETAGSAVHAAGTASSTAFLIQHSQVGGGGVGGGALSGGATGLPHHRDSRLMQQQLSKVWLLQHLSAVVHHTAGVQREKNKVQWRGENGEMHKQGKGSARIYKYQWWQIPLKLHLGQKFFKIVPNQCGHRDLLHPDGVTPNTHDLTSWKQKQTNKKTQKQTTRPDAALTGCFRNSLSLQETHSFLCWPWKKLAHSKQVFLLPTQKTEGIPTTSIIRYFMRKRATLGLLICSTCPDNRPALRHHKLQITIMSMTASDAWKLLLNCPLN